MNVLGRGLSFQDATEITGKGGFVRHAHWHHRPVGSAAPEATALTKIGGVFVVCTGPDKPLHRWDPSIQEIQSKEWEHVEF